MLIDLVVVAVVVVAAAIVVVVAGAIVVVPMFNMLGKMLNVSINWTLNIFFEMVEIKSVYSEKSKY